MEKTARFLRFRTALEEHHADVDYLMVHADFCNSVGAIENDDFNELVSIAYPDTQQTVV